MISSIFLTGSTGFVGRNLINTLNNSFEFYIYKRNSILNVNQDAVIHLAGIAHDTSGKINSDLYYKVNTDFTKKIFDAFLNSNSKIFIMLSSVKAVSDSPTDIVTESTNANPLTVYGKSKLLAEEYVLSKKLSNKRVFILRPCMIHGFNNKGNLNLLYNLVKKGFPWPLGAFNNQRSYCSIENLLFLIKELTENKAIPSGIYNVSDDEPLSTNRVILLIAKSLNRNQTIWNFPINLIKILARLGDKIQLPLNSERLKKLTESYIVCNKKIVQAIGKKLPIPSDEGMLKTFESFNK